MIDILLIYVTTFSLLASGNMLLNPLEVSKDKSDEVTEIARAISQRLKLFEVDTTKI